MTKEITKKNISIASIIILIILVIGSISIGIGIAKAQSRAQLTTTDGHEVALNKLDKNHSKPLTSKVLKVQNKNLWAMKANKDAKSPLSKELKVQTKDVSAKDVHLARDMHKGAKLLFQRNSRPSRRTCWPVMCTKINSRRRQRRSRLN